MYNVHMARPLHLAVNRIFQWVKGSASLLWLVAVAAYLSLMAGRAFYKNYQSQQEVLGLQHQLSQDAAEKERLQALLVYYGTTSYQEVELRSDLLLKLPNEKVYALPESSSGVPSDAVPVAAPSTHAETGLPVWRQWLEYLLHGTR